MDLIQMTVTGSILIGCIGAIRFLAIHRLPKMAFWALWIIAALRLLLPWSLPLPDGIQTGAAALSNTVRDLSAGIFCPSFMGQEGGWGSGETPPGAPFPDTPLPSLVMVVWLAGAICLAVYFAAAYLWNVRMFKRSVPDSTPYVQEWKKAHRIFRPLEVRNLDVISSPMTYGILHPVILLPKGLDRSGEAVLWYVLTHEYVHIRRFDAMAKLLLTAALCIHWFNPLVWAMYILANRDLELSCDACVLRRAGRAGRAGYALSLLSLEETRSPGAPFCNHFSKNAMEERIEAIMKYKKTPAIAMIAAWILAAGATTAFAASAPPDGSREYSLNDLPPGSSVIQSGDCVAGEEKPEWDTPGSSGREAYIERVENGDYIAMYSIDELPEGSFLTTGGCGDAR